MSAASIRSINFRMPSRGFGVLCHRESKLMMSSLICAVARQWKYRSLLWIYSLLCDRKIHISLPLLYIPPWRKLFWSFELVFQF